jgi:hypothetical protein
MSIRRPREHAGRQGPALTVTARRDAANELYDRACELVAAAHELQLAARREGSDGAIAATLGCAHAALAELAETYRALHQVSDGMFRSAGLAGGDGALESEDRFAEAIEALDRARAASDAAREAVGPPLAELAGLRAG